jgi:hypothetical protein
MATFKLVSHVAYLSTSKVEGDAREIPTRNAHHSQYRISFVFRLCPQKLAPNAFHAFPSSWHWENFLAQRMLKHKEQAKKSRVANGCFKRPSPYCGGVDMTP